MVLTCSTAFDEISPNLAPTFEARLPAVLPIAANPLPKAETVDLTPAGRPSHMRPKAPLTAPAVSDATDLTPPKTPRMTVVAPANAPPTDFAAEPTDFTAEPTRGIFCTSPETPEPMIEKPVLNAFAAAPKPVADFEDCAANSASRFFKRSLAPFRFSVDAFRFSAAVCCFNSACCSLIAAACA